MNEIYKFLNSLKTEKGYELSSKDMIELTLLLCMSLECTKIIYLKFIKDYRKENK